MTTLEEMCFYCIVFTILYTVLQLMYRYHPLMQHIFTMIFISTIELDNVTVEFLPPESIRLNEQCMRTVCKNSVYKLLLLGQIL